jgi:antirestriction protein
METPKLYCGTYGKYNNGSIQGKWMDLSEYDSAEEFFAACKELHKDERDPEFMFQDFECFPKSLYSESMGTEEIEAIIAYAKLSDDQKEMVEAFCDATGYTIGKYSIEQIEDALVFTADGSSFSSVEEQLGYDYAENGMIDIPESVAPYFNYKSYGEDMMMDLSESNGYVFNLDNL